jgi:hypothetical protein
MTKLWTSKPWATVHNETYGSNDRQEARTGVLSCKAKTSQVSSPLVEFTIYRNDKDK